ncbi:hypothetical protein PTTG_26307 [Puccinia triticina 1-1 BBBD Race 1]|uniref:Uncharacterized protein n=1 Tax=Puccinia triticina (isolate 1-1 / race 1 (BBBD)) TaxID=630390 RepID=A0A180GW03_PUCT1|nr:hypothetical protein PTTG_26307 [Puccinia triticina 1-1 BBBD Race 1]
MLPLIGGHFTLHLPHPHQATTSARPSTLSSHFVPHKQCAPIGAPKGSEGRKASEAHKLGRTELIHTPRSASSLTLSLTTPQQSKPVPRSSQSIREKRRIFEQPVNPSTDDLPYFYRLTNSSLAVSIALPSHSASGGALSTSLGVDRRHSSVASERQQSKRKPTPAEIKLQDETRSVKALP